ncbi:DUF6090 family protein [Eudoraea sp.]|uniref:DUF6090 family protein n=1 Tax=Eudoraea sp. TaxID=1979955 RepID=UPI003C737BCF
MKKIIKHLKKNWYRYTLEIFVVIIGILIAFSLNNWNEGRKIKKTADTYKEKLINDLASDTIQINKFITNGLKMQKAIEAYFEYFDTEDVPLNDLLLKASNVPANFVNYFPINHTFRDMQQSGNITLLTEEQRKELMELSNSQEFMAIILENTMEDIKMHIHERNMLLDFDLSNSDFHARTSWVRDTDSKRRGLLYQHNVLTGFYHQLKSTNYRANIIKELTKKCLTLLNKNE